MARHHSTVSFFQAKLPVHDGLDGADYRASLDPISAGNAFEGSYLASCDQMPILANGTPPAACRIVLVLPSFLSISGSR